MAYKNDGAENAQAKNLLVEAPMRAQVLGLIALIASFTLALVVVFSMPMDLAFADNEAADAPGAANGGAGGTTATTPATSGGDVSSGEVSAGGDDASLTTADSGGLKSDETGTAESSSSASAEPILLRVTIVSREGQALQSFQIEQGKAITFVDSNDEVLVRYVADESFVVEPVAPVKDGFDFAGWLVKINDEGNAVISPQYVESPPPSPSSSSSATTDDVKTVRSSSGTVTTNSPKTGDLLSLALPIAIAGISLLAIMALLFARRRG